MTPREAELCGLSTPSFQRNRLVEVGNQTPMESGNWWTYFSLTDTSNQGAELMPVQPGAT